MLFFLILFSAILYGGYILLSKTSIIDIPQDRYIASSGEQISLVDEEFKEIAKVYRGTKVKAYDLEIEDDKENVYIKIEYDNKILYVKKQSLVKDTKDIVMEDNVYVRTYTNIYSDLDEGTITSLVNKGDELIVLGYDYINDTGEVNAYRIQKDNQEGYVYGKYVLLNKEEALLNNEQYHEIHSKRKDIYSGVGGNGGNLDYYPVTKPKFEDNVMPDKVYALYLNGGSNIIGNVDAYIEFAKTTKINAFVVDIKDANSPSYKARVYEQYSPTNYKYGNNSFENYRQAIKKIKDAGYYVIGRITAFKDDYYVNDNPDTAIMDKRTNKPFKTGGIYWPSPFQRKVWEFNVNLAKEAVTEMGFNEIQFDYVRFPDRVVAQEKAGHLDFRNIYNEEKVQAIQKF